MIQSSKLDAGTRARLYRGGLAELREPSARATVERYLNGQHGGALATTLYLHQQLGLVDDMLHYFDRASMATSLEVRVPFLDHHVVEYCAGVPDRLKVKRLEGKHLLRVAARDLIPQRIIEKRKIGFFSHAMGAWFREQAGGSVADYLLQPDPAYAEILDRNLVAGLVERAHMSTTRSVNSLLLSVLMLEVWLTTYLPKALGPTPSPPVPAGARS